MPYVNKSYSNFVGGELSPRMRGRAGLDVYEKGLYKVVNFIPETQGPLRYRNGTVRVTVTEANQEGVLIPFVFNDTQAYVIEATEKRMRFYMSEGIILEDNKNITAATSADPAVITSASHGYSDGDMVYISSVTGMTELNGRFFKVSNKDTNTFELQDEFGVDVDSSSYTAYVSGGTVARVYGIDTPYVEEHLDKIRYTQNADTMYLVHKYYEPRKLTRTDHDAWSIAIFSRTNDPFLNKKVISAVTQATEGVVTSTSHGYSDGDIIIIEAVVGMIELNGGVFVVSDKDANTFKIKNLDGDYINTTGYSAYVSDGYASNVNLLPSCLSFYEARLFYGRSDLYTERFWGSRAPSSVGVSRFDDFTTGTEVDDAVIYTLAPVNGRVDSIQWISGNSNYLALGTFGGVSMATGGGTDEAITPTSIKIKPLDPEGCADVASIPYGDTIIYVQAGNLVIRSLEYNVIDDGYQAVDRMLVADHISLGGIKKIAFAKGRPDILLAVREDGVLLTLTYKAKEDVSGWARFVLGGDDAKVLDVCVIPRSDNYDQIWLLVERTEGGRTIRTVEYLADEQPFPDRYDYFEESTTEDDDTTKFENDMYEKQKQSLHLDSAYKYDGFEATLNAAATLSLSGVSGDSITFNTDVDFFISGCVGDELHKKTTDSDGFGLLASGIAEITEYVSAQEVVCEILQDFDSLTDMAPGEWAYAPKELSGLYSREGDTVNIVTDGSPHPDKEVIDGKVSLDWAATVAHVGYKYRGIGITMGLEMGGITGPGYTKVKNIDEVYFKVLNTLGLKYGTALYNLEEIPFRSTDSVGNRPQPLFSGLVSTKYQDGWGREKQVFFIQDSPCPCIIQSIDIYGEVVDE